MTNSAGVTTDYIYDGMLVREMQVAGPNNFSNIAPGTLVDTATYLQGPSGPAYRRNDLTGIPSWYVYNGLGSVVGEVDPAGNYTASGEYDVYGAPRASTQSGTFDTRQRYVGQLGHQTDPETGGLIYMQARYYDPGMTMTALAGEAMSLQIAATAAGGIALLAVTCCCLECFVCVGALTGDDLASMCGQ
jgi:YD repeat-containing protein